MEQISIYNTRTVVGLTELVATIDCDLAPNERFLIVVMTDEIGQDDGLSRAMLSAKSNGSKIIVMWPPDGKSMQLPDPLLQLRTALIQFDGEALHDVICRQKIRHDGSGGGPYPAAKTDRHCS